MTDKVTHVFVLIFANNFRLSDTETKAPFLCHSINGAAKIKQDMDNYKALFQEFATDYVNLIMSMYYYGISNICVKSKLLIARRNSPSAHFPWSNHDVATENYYL